jgi:hypothetical protein
MSSTVAMSFGSPSIRSSFPRADVHIEKGFEVFDVLILYAEERV